MKQIILIGVIFHISHLPLFSQDLKEKVNLSVQPDTSLYHKPLQLKVSGLEAQQKVTIRLKAIDAEQNNWESQAVFVANDAGIVDPAELSPIDGSYTGIHPMGLFWAMKSKDDHQIATGKGYNATIEVILESATIASKTIFRRSTRELDALEIKYIQKRDSIIADYYLPKKAGKRPAIIFLGGSGGQFRQERSSLLASEGFAVLNLKYFRYEGLPDGITEVPLEYVKKAHQWLQAQPEIDADNIGIMGRSMGSQLALLYAVHYKGIRYVIVEAPSNVVWFGWEDGKSSFTFQGKGFPYAFYSDKDSEKIELEMQEKGIQYHDGPKFLSAFKDQAMMDQAAIQVENIQCPLLFVSGKEDKVWPSHKMSEMMMQRLKEQQFQYDYRHYTYENAGHNFAGGGQGCGIPYLPPEDYSKGSAKGGTDKGNALAAIQSWNDILEFIEQHKWAR